MSNRGVQFVAVIAAGLLASGAAGLAIASEAATDSTSADTTSAAAAPAKAPSVHQYVGVKKCKLCHNAEKTGAQFKKWSETKHAKAFATLGGSLAKSIAQKKGIADPQTSAACLKCHQTGYGEPANHFAATYVATDGVQCEACHGAGSDYIKRSVMEGITNGTLKPEDYGLVMPTKERCVVCHNNESPTFVEMNFASDSTKIAHANPQGHKHGGDEAAPK